MIVPRVEVDYLAEVGVGPLHVSVVVLSLGRTSFRLRLVATQEGAVAARAEAVLVRYDYAQRLPQPLSDAHRALLLQHLAEPS